MNAAIPAALVFLDCETTGLDPRKRLAWDVAMIRRDHHEDGSFENTVHQFFVDVDLSDADPFALNVGRYWERHPAGQFLSGRTTEPDAFGAPVALDTIDAAVTVARVTHGAHLVGAIPSFDAITLEPLLWAAGLVPSWHYHLVDVESLMVGYLTGRLAAGATPGVFETKPSPPWKSDQLSRACGVEPATEDERHTALGDARWAMRCYDKVMGVTYPAADEEAPA